VVIDTLNRSLSGSESSDEAMGKYIKAADTIRETFECAVVIVHHCGIAGDRPRGHTSLTGAADAQLAVKRDEADNIVVSLEHMKDGPEGDTIASRLVSIDVGTDDEGDAITSCFVEPAEALMGNASKRLPQSTIVARNALVEALDERGFHPEPRPAQVPNHLKVVTKDQWREQAYLRGISPEGGDRAKQKAFKSAYDRLLADGRIAVWDELVWLTA
jgi:hypothetical protein